MWMEEGLICGWRRAMVRSSPLRRSGASAGDEGEVATGEGPTDEERVESLRALRELRGRVPLMGQGDVDAAMDRLLARSQVWFVFCPARDWHCGCCNDLPQLLCGLSG